MSETTIEVLIERIENIKKLIEDFQSDNKDEHTTLIEKVSYTNGKVRSLQIWKASIIGALSIISIIASYTISDFLATKREFAANERQQALNMEKISQLERKIDQLK